MRKIYKTGIGFGSFPDGRTRLFVEFSDGKEKGGDFQWTPNWNDVCELMIKAVEVERQNKPESTYLEQFADVCAKVITKYAPAMHVEVKGGRCVEYRAVPEISKVYVKVLWREISDKVGWVAGETTWELGVPLSEERLRNLIGKDVYWTVWNEKVIAIREKI
jgi:hypothetical protein